MKDLYNFVTILSEAKQGKYSQEVISNDLYVCHEAFLPSLKKE